MCEKNSPVGDTLLDLHRKYSNAFIASAHVRKSSDSNVQ